MHVHRVFKELTHLSAQLKPHFLLFIESFV